MKCNKRPEVEIPESEAKSWHARFVKRFLNKQGQIVEEITDQVFREKREVEDAFSKPSVLGFSEAYLLHDPTLAKEQKPLADVPKQESEQAKLAPNTPVVNADGKGKRGPKKRQK